MNENNAQVGSQAEVLEEGRDFDRNAFVKADEEISMHVQSATTDSGTIKEIIEDANELARSAAARERFSQSFAQSAYKAYLTLMGRDAVAITNDQARGIEKVIKENEKQLRSIDRDLRLKSREYEAFLSELNILREKVDTYEFGISGYRKQIDEIGFLIAAQREGNSHGSVVELSALDPDCYSMDVSDLQNMRVEIKTKIRAVELELSNLYFKASNITTQLEQSERTRRVLEAQYNTGLEDMGRQLEQQCGFYSPDFIMICKQQIERAKLQEKAENSINQRARVVEVVTSFLEGNLGLILNPYKARFYRSHEGEKAGAEIEKALDTMAERGEVGMESLRTKAYAGFNQFLS